VRAILAEQSVRESTARGYFVTIARNLWLRHRQKLARETLLPADIPDATRLETIHVLEALHALPPELRDPLVLFAQGGLTYEEIAAQLQLTLATVKIRIFRARQRLEDFR